MEQTVFAHGTLPKLETSVSAELIFLKMELNVSVMRISFNLREVYAFAITMLLKSIKPVFAFKILSKMVINVNAHNLFN